MNVRYPSMDILGFCPECRCDTLDAMPSRDAYDGPPPKVVCSDCGYTERRPRDYLARLVHELRNDTTL